VIACVDPPGPEFERDLYFCTGRWLEHRHAILELLVAVVDPIEVTPIVSTCASDQRGGKIDCEGRSHGIGHNSLMKTATISETKNQLSALLDRVRHGETILITDRNQPVARLEPVVRGSDAGPDEGRLARLERAGVIRRARHGRLEEIVRVPPPTPEAGGDIVAALLEERKSGR
jgi:prevent-host-death family protein